PSEAVMNMPSCGRHRERCRRGTKGNRSGPRRSIRSAAILRSPFSARKCRSMRPIHELRNSTMHRCWPVLIVMASAWPVWADDSSPGVKRALLVCGHPGDDDHAKLFGETFAKIHHGLTETLGFPEEYISAFFGVKPGDAALPGVAVQSPGSREAIAKAIAQLRNELRPQDTLWVIVMGHAHFDGRHAFLNLPGPDMHQDDFGGLFRDLACREQVFLITTPASGYFIKPLSAPGRIVITATEADLEV